MPQPEPSAANLALEWLRFAQSDLKLACVERPAGVMWEMLAFHAQQSAEKAFKAVLVRRGVNFPPTHNLAVLRELLPADIELPRAVSDATMLSVYAVASRYPQEVSPIEEADYLDAVAQAKAVLDWAEQTIAREGP